MFWVWTTHLAGAGCQGTDVGRSALGGAPGDAGVCTAPGPVSDLRHSDRADRVRRRPRAYHASAAPSRWPGLSVDADLTCGRASRRQLEQGPSCRVRVSRRVGPSPPETTTAVSGG